MNDFAPQMMDTILPSPRIMSEAFRNIEDTGDWIIEHRTGTGTTVQRVTKTHRVHRKQSNHRPALGVS